MADAVERRNWELKLVGLIDHRRDQQKKKTNKIIVRWFSGHNSKRLDLWRCRNKWINLNMN